jgi:hypothetical protein
MAATLVTGSRVMVAASQDAATLPVVVVWSWPPQEKIFGRQ